jgi:Polyketide cyclase / dehydrase and lipid transport
MWAVEHSVETSARAKAIWRLWADVERWPEWNAGVERIELRGPFAAGSTILMTPPGDEPVELRIAEAVEPELFVDEADGGDFVVRTTHRIEAVGDERSRITYPMEITGPAAEAVGPEIGERILCGMVTSVIEGYDRTTTSPEPRFCRAPDSESWSGIDKEAAGRLTPARESATLVERSKEPSNSKGGGTMSHAQQILETHPRTLRVEIGVLAACIDWCFDCAQSCTACADADLGEPDVETLIACISLCRSCSDICTSTGKVLSRQTEFVPELAHIVIQACIEACRRCGDECERHARHHEHCRVCAETCRRCEQACKDALAALPT